MRTFGSTMTSNASDSAQYEFTKWSSIPSI